MNKAKVVPCPSGPETPETFRMYEALEAGAVPLVDGCTPGGPCKWYWYQTFGDDFPLPIIDDWSVLPAAMQLILPKFEEGRKVIQIWWQDYKYKFFQWLGEDLKALGAL